MSKRDIVRYTRLGKLGVDDDKAAEYLHWDKLGDEARFETAWELVEQAFEMQGRNLDELRLQRHVENIVRRES